MLRAVASPVGYQTFCPVGAALNVVGERWALLIVRDLFLGPRRYSELLKGLGGIPTDILAARLRTLQEHGVVRQVGEGRARRYELTESGQALPGAPRARPLGSRPAPTSRRPGRDPDASPAHLAPPRRRGATRARQTASTRFAWKRRRSESRSSRGQIHAAPDSEPDTTIELTRPGLRALILGARASEIEQAGDLSIQGNRRRAHAFLNTLTGPPLLAGLRQQLQGGGG